MLLRAIAFATALLASPFASFGAAGACAPAPRASACIQAALDSLDAGEILKLGPGEYGLEAALQLTRPGVALEGSGDATLLRRAVSVKDGEGVINLRGSGQALRRFRFDGGITEPRRIPYVDPAGGPSVFGAPIYANPMHPDLLRDTSITVHREASKVLIEGLTIEHTGGYAIFLDARYGDIREVWIRGCTLRNNRPHLFGRAAQNGRPEDLRYGAWTGGIHYQNDGRDLPFARYALRGLRVEDCTFERIAGHAFWGHGYGFQTLNEDIRVERCRFTDIGLDAVQIGNARRAVVADNQMRRIGYVTESDDDLGRPAWYPGNREDMADNVPPVAIDTTGLVSESAYRANELQSVNGTAIDLDGFTRGEVVGNRIGIPGREAAYAAVVDRIVEFGPYLPAKEPSPPGNLTKGINLSNTSAIEATHKVRIAGNRLINLGGYAMLIIDSQDGLIEGNEIRHYSMLNGPIVLANSLREPKDRHETSGNLIRENVIFFPWQAACVTEGDNIGGGDLPVRGPNYVYANECNGELGELMPGRASGSRNAPPP